MNPHNNTDNFKNSNIERVRKLFFRHGDFLKVIISLHISDKEDADDFFQELFLFLIVKPLPKDVKNTKALLNKIVSDKSKDYYRKKSSHKRRISGYSEIIKSKKQPDAAEKIFIEKEQIDKFYDTIRKNLSHQEAQAVTLKFQHDQNNREIAEKMNINSRSVSRYISVGLKKLKKYLG